MGNRVKLIESSESPSSAQMDGLKDFDMLLKAYQHQKKAGVRKGLSGGIAGVIVIVALSVILLFDFENKGKNEGAQTNVTPDIKLHLIGPEKPEDYSFYVPAVTGRDQTGVETKKIEENKKLKKKKERVDPVPEEPKVSLDEKRAVVIQLIEANPLHGYPHLYSYFETNLIYPEAFRKDSIEGIVQVQFTVARDSSIVAVQVVNSLGEAFDKEALRLIQNMPRWVPASYGETYLSRSFILPIRFEIK